MTIILDPPPYVLQGQVTSSVIGFERVLVGRNAQLAITLADSTGTATDPSPDAATVQVVRFSDGVELANTAANDTGTGGFAFTLTPAHTAQLDFLIVNWTATVGGYQQTVTQVVEVCGGFLFSIADARRLEPFNNATKYPASDIASARTLAEQAFEDACGQSFVPRYHREYLNATDLRSVLLTYPRVLNVRALSVDGTAWTSDQITALTMSNAGELYGVGGSWCSAYRSHAVQIDYEHGYAAPPLRVSRAALLLARSYLVSGPLDERAATFSSVEGGTYSLVTAGRSGSTFGHPEIDAAVQQYGLATGVA